MLGCFVVSAFPPQSSSPPVVGAPSRAHRNQGARLELFEIPLINPSPTIARGVRSDLTSSPDLRWMADHCRWSLSISNAATLVRAERFLPRFVAAAILWAILQHQCWCMNRCHREARLNHLSPSTPGSQKIASWLDSSPRHPRQHGKFNPESTTVVFNVTIHSVAATGAAAMRPALVSFVSSPQ